MQQQERLLSRRRRQRGLGMLDGLVAMAILAFGLLALTRFQSRMLAQATDAQARLTATQYADELLNTVLVDTANAGCYTLPDPGTCGSGTAKAMAADWKTRLVAALPSGAATAALSNENGRTKMTVTLGWDARDADNPSAKRKLEVTTDVTPPNSF